MSDRPIQVGDLVAIVRACCKPSEKYIGKIFIARPPRHQPMECGDCGTLHPAPHFTDDTGTHWASYRLKRIPPLSELEGQRTYEKMKEPA